MIYLEAKHVLKEILESKIIAIIRGVSPENIVETARALKDGGIKCLEVTFDQTSEAAIDETLLSLDLIKKAFSDEVLLGAGTVITKKQVKMAIDAGAEYIISPNTDVEVIRYTKSLNKISIPGALTPSEAVTAYKAGADIVKLFPTAVFGTSYIKAIRGPLSHIPFTAVGGVTKENAADFIDAGASGVGVGGNLVSRKAIEAGDFYKIKETAEEYIKILSGK